LTETSLCFASAAAFLTSAVAGVADGQNAGDPLYKNMAGNFETSAAYKTACDLACKGQALAGEGWFRLSRQAHDAIN
jgi:malate synthase